MKPYKAGLNTHMMWYWVKYILLLCFKLIIGVPFIICGPIMAIIQWRGLTNHPIEGIFICCLFSLFIIPDSIYTIIVPWRGSDGRDFPVWMEEWRSAKDEKHHEMMYLTVWRYV